MTTRTTFARVVTTTDVHSALGDATGMLSHLHSLRPTSLIADCGDFFEGTGYYQLGAGRLEREILTTLYDVLAPGNHGWPHYFEPTLHELTVCANAMNDTDGRPLFHRLRIVDIGGRQVAVTAVISPQAFDAIPAHQRAGQHVTDPVGALREVLLEHHHHVDAWIVLSHSGFETDLKLAEHCPFVDIVFAGHCHSDLYGPAHVGDTLVVKGPELAAGYAAAEPVGAGWAARTTCFPKAAAVPDALADLTDKITETGRMLTAVLGTVNEPYRNTVVDRRQLLSEVAARLHTGLGATVILNETALRPAYLGDTITLGALLAVEPFGNQLVHAFLTDEHSQHPARLLAHLTKRAGPLVTAPHPLPARIRSVLTTAYLADSYLTGRTYEAGLKLGDAVRHVLAAPPRAEGVSR
ncbi:bifunctional metallophosphatase/5'-nucleotidase [Streptomyces sp. MBT56]|uniref:bifunctional metallophosphatase/5'-nucleotidase n=1 Tax=unclassified Streptomyces TaxID=2593676 RepID=UPI00190AD50E|nr:MULTISPECIES: bifunctional metallophosphatase/5'-nucleotidase [unclassified Streptomyces]MBK3560303.1 bifunctional metallophosphatase/5'-nucleotidase [Streptomyces sp. MBT56]MBK3599969.1 bifunctional metallophosphatase/5'-nucleotidase [Streptomyces sp. MBT54]MBK3613223.1 bifunctional metallophosphatase/5'-nucleotidase [Streptomyces sp. MBT98]MBK3627454.1 bifunctional metallophosphatase/5'-nucleotidase [Streptomyces sp. MBT49]